MDVKKSIKKVLACATASAMALCLTMPTAFAEGDDTNNAKEAYISKTYNREVVKDETFSFTAEQIKTGTGVNTNDAPINSMPSIAFTDGQTGKTTKRERITLPKYTDAGKYEYKVTESQTADPTVTDGKHEKLIMSKAEYTMDVYVVNDNDNVTISKIIVNKTKDDNGDTATGKVNIGNTDANGFNFTNTYVQEAGTGDTPSTPGEDYNNYGSLNVSKTINANGGTADTEKEFEFTATFTFPEGTDKDTLGGVKGNGSNITLDNNSYTFKLKDSESMKFTGLPVGTTMTVTESATPNYKGSAKVTINGADAQTVTADKYDADLIISENTLGKAKNTVDVTNTYNYVPTTGIIMNTLPYVMMIALGGVALVGYIYLKRRKYSN